MSVANTEKTCAIIFGADDIQYIDIETVTSRFPNSKLKSMYDETKCELVLDSKQLFDVVYCILTTSSVSSIQSDLSAYTEDDISDTLSDLGISWTDLEKLEASEEAAYKAMLQSMQKKVVDIDYSGGKQKKKTIASVNDDKEGTPKKEEPITLEKPKKEDPLNKSKEGVSVLPNEKKKQVKVKIDMTKQVYAAAAKNKEMPTGPSRNSGNGGNYRNNYNGDNNGDRSNRNNSSQNGYVRRNEDQNSAPTNNSQKQFANPHNTGFLTKHQSNYALQPPKPKEPELPNNWRHGKATNPATAAVEVPKKTSVPPGGIDFKKGKGVTIDSKPNKKSFAVLKIDDEGDGLGGDDADNYDE